MSRFTTADSNTSPPAVMQIHRSTVQGIVVVKLEGRFEFASRNEYKQFMTDILQSEHCRLVIDLHQVTFLDSSALGLLLLTDQNLKLKQGQFALIGPTGYVREVMELANIPRVISVFESLNEALANLAPSGS